MIEKEAFEWLDGNQLSYDIWDKKYRYNNESFQDWLNRVSAFNEDIKRLIYEKKFLFGGRILSNRGINNQEIKATLSNCYVLSVDDSIESIYKCCSDIARTYSYGGGVGIDISKLRPKGAEVHNSAKTTSGAVSFMKTFDTVTSTICQNGRRGALMISLDVRHPDIEEFINIKANTDQITSANISVRVNDEFMQAVKNDEDYYLRWPCDQELLLQATAEMNFEYDVLTPCYFAPDLFSDKRELCGYIKKVKAKQLFQKLAENNWNYAEPGILYWDKIDQWNMMEQNADFQYAGVNPCAEEPLTNGSACLLGAMNIVNYVKNKTFQWDQFEKDIKLATIGLNDVLIEGISLHPLQIQRDSAAQWRAIGLGLFDLAGALVKLGLVYGSKEAQNFAYNLTHKMLISSFEQSCDLNKDNISFNNLFDSDFYKFQIYPYLKEEYKNRYPLNSQLLTIAPTGSISTMFNAFSSGGEPAFALSYTRTTKSLHNKDVIYTVHPKLVEQYLYKYNCTMDQLPPEFISSEDLNWKDRIDMQAALQSNIDASISSTINLPENTTIEDVYNLYMYAWEMGLKGVTIFRTNCLRTAILSKEAPKEITQTSAPKRPKKLSAHYYPVKVKGEQFIIMIGLLDSKPYEIFAFKDTTGFKCKDHEGVLIKKAKGHYAYESDCCSIDKIEVEAIEARTSIYLSMLLRHGVDIKQIIKTAKKVNPGITSFTSAIVRVLSKYTEAEVTSETCPECGEKLVRESGCISCKSCGYSKCG